MAGIGWHVVRASTADPQLVRAVSWPALEPGKPSGLIWAKQAYASPLSSMGATRRLTACISELRTSPVVAGAAWDEAVTWLSFIEVPSHEEAGCRN